MTAASTSIAFQPSDAPSGPITLPDWPVRGASAAAHTHAPSQALWRQIADALRAPIASGLWPNGARMPTEAQMAQHFGVNRHTVRRALAYLSRDGFVLIAKGRGVFVADAPKLGFIIDGRTSFWQNVRAARLEPSTVLLKVGDEEAGLRLGGLLDIHPQRMVLHLRCLLLANGVPLALESSWLSKDRFPRFGDAFRRAGTISEALASYGVEEPWRDSSRIITRVADDAECALLRAGEPAALLVSEAVHRDGRGAPVALTSTAFCAQRVSLHITHGGAPA